jgi:2,3-bisphosphoglycerate-dependent phosphoglycerate mutase
MTTLFLVRHGESEANVRRIFSNGKVDLPLTELGRRQAERAAAWLEGRGIQHVFHAPLLRARETAEIVARRLTVGTTVLRDLDEVRVGGLDGREDSASWGAFAAVLDRWFAGEMDAAFPGGETLAEALARYEAALREISRRYPEGTVAAITHGAIQLTVLPRLCPTIDPAARSLPNVAISTLEVTPEGFACSLWASTAHLE